MLLASLEERGEASAIFHFPRDSSGPTSHPAPPILYCATLPGWRNGRRDGLKLRWPKGRVGSIPTPGTMSLLQAS